MPGKTGFKIPRCWKYWAAKGRCVFRWTAEQREHGQYWDCTHCFTPDVLESALTTFWWAIKCPHISGNLDTFFPMMTYCMKKKWGVGKFWIAAHRVEVNDHSTRAILHCAVIIYWKVGGCKQQLSRETNQLKKIMSYRFPDSDPGKIINYKINVIHGTWDLILSMLGFERFWLCWKMWMLQESSSCLYKRWFYKLKQS